MPKVLFIQPTQYGANGGLCKQDKIHLPGLVFPLLAAMTPEHWEVDVRIEVVDEIPWDTDADLVGLGTMGHTIWRAVEIAREFRKRGKKTFLGGYMASLAAEQALQYVDSVVVGDAEISYPKLLRDFEKTGRLEPIYRNPVDSLKGLPLPRYEILLQKPIGDMLPVQAGRGCPHLCAFCSIACIYKGRYLARTVDEVMRDIHRVRDLGFDRFYLIDDNIISNPRFLETLCREIEPLQMKWSSQCSLALAKNPRLLELAQRSGCQILSFGLESITQDGLNKLGKAWVKVAEHEELLKRITDAGIMPSTEMMVGTDSDTEESIKATAEFVERAGIPIPRFYILTPIPGTALFHEYKADGRIVHEDFQRYDGTTCVHRPALLSPEKLTEQYWWLNQRIFRMGSILKRTLFNRAFWRHPLLHLFAFGVNLHYRRYVMRRVPPNIF